jgi:hypothetical protein
MKWIAAAIVVAILVAVVWQRELSPEARIARAYDVCMKRFGGKADARAPAAAPAPVDPVLADSLGKAMQDLVRGVTAGMSGAVCGAVRDACRADFDGAVCQNALAGFTEP